MDKQGGIRKLLLATRNGGKLQEYRLLLDSVSLSLTTLSEEGVEESVPEDALSFEENARLKAVTFAKKTGLLTLADDSGLAVDVLGGEPGPLSARYAGEGASDAERIRYLLARLKGVPWERRTARFRCVAGIAFPDGEVHLCSGECQGIIGFDPKGSYGFGYDPIFYLPRLAKSMAELTPSYKNRISHRGKAARKARSLLLRLEREGKI